MSAPGKIAKLILSSLFKKPATINYPITKTDMPKGYRGKLTFSADLCIGCKLCMRDCPADAIEIRKIGEKKFEMEVNLAKCIYCGQCTDSCPKKALAMSDDFELANLKPEKLKIIYNADTQSKTPV